MTLAPAVVCASCAAHAAAGSAWLAFVGICLYGALLLATDEAPVREDWP